MDTKFIEMIRKEIMSLLEETFEKCHGAFLDRGTSFLETLNCIDHQLASKKFVTMEETIAGHVYHTRFYIIVLQEYLTGKRTGKTDWNESWIIKNVNEQEWEKLKAALKDEYEKLIVFINQIEKWNDEDYFGSILSILAHCAYHLGAIRQLKEF